MDAVAVLLALLYVVSLGALATRSVWDYPRWYANPRAGIAYRPLPLWAFIALLPFSLVIDLLRLSAWRRTARRMGASPRQLH